MEKRRRWSSVSIYPGPKGHKLIFQDLSSFVSHSCRSATNVNTPRTSPGAIIPLSSLTHHLNRHDSHAFLSSPEKTSLIPILLDYSIHFSQVSRYEDSLFSPDFLFPILLIPFQSFQIWLLFLTFWAISPPFVSFASRFSCFLWNPSLVGRRHRRLDCLRRRKRG